MCPYRLTVAVRQSTGRRRPDLLTTRSGKAQPVPDQLAQQLMGAHLQHLAVVAGNIVQRFKGAKSAKSSNGFFIGIVGPLGILDW